MAAYLGDTKMKMLQEFGSIKEKYGAQPASCHNVFQSVCPWDSAGMSAIFMKLMVSLPPPAPPSLQPTAGVQCCECCTRSSGAAHGQRFQGFQQLC